MQISNSVHTTHFRHDRYEIRSKTNDWEAKKLFKVFGGRNPKGPSKQGCLATAKCTMLKRG